MRGAIPDVRAQRHVHSLRHALGHAGMVSALRDAGKAAGQLPQHRRDLLELAGSALEVGEAARRFLGARRDVVRLRTVLPRDFGHGVDALAQLAESLVLITCGGGDPLRVRRRLGRRRHDRVQRLERCGGELLDAAHVHLPATHLLDDLAHLRWMSCTSSPASRAVLELCSASRRTSSATTAKPLPCLPARAASMAAFNANRLVMSASSRIDAMNPVMRRLTCPSPWTLLEASPTNALRATSRPMASRI